MEELTFKKTNGLVGIAKMNAENQWKKILGCVNKLHEYEQIGLTPNQITELKKENASLKKEVRKLQSPNYVNKLVNIEIKRRKNENK